jgi:hypothetical protein
MTVDRQEMRGSRWEHSICSWEAPDNTDTPFPSVGHFQPPSIRWSTGLRSRSLRRPTALIADVYWIGQAHRRRAERHDRRGGRRRRLEPADAAAYVERALIQRRDDVARFAMSFVTLLDVDEELKLSIDAAAHKFFHLSLTDVAILHGFAERELALRRADPRWRRRRSRGTFEVRPEADEVTIGCCSEAIAGLDYLVARARQTRSARGPAPGRGPPAARRRRASRSGREALAAGADGKNSGLGLPPALRLSGLPVDDDDDMPGGERCDCAPDHGEHRQVREAHFLGVAFPVHPSGNFDGIRDESTTHMPQHEVPPTPTQLLPSADRLAPSTRHPRRLEQRPTHAGDPVGSGPMNRANTLPLPAFLASGLSCASSDPQQAVVIIGAQVQEAMPMPQEARPMPQEAWPMPRDARPMVQEARPMYPSLPDPLSAATGVRMAPAVPRFVDPATTVTRKKRGILMPMLGSAAAAAVVMVGVVAFVVLRKPAEPTSPSSKASAASEAHATSAPTTISSTEVSVATTSETPAPLPTTPPTSATATAPLPPAVSATPSLPGLEGADAEAVIALDKMRDAVAGCVTNSTHVLPGTSPPGPASWSLLSSGTYQPSLRDWGSPFFHCTKFRLEAPMRFRLQWQLEQPNWSGAGIAWIDDDGDGTVERSYAFQATLIARDMIEFGPIRAIEPTRKLPVPR